MNDASMEDKDIVRKNLDRELKKIYSDPDGTLPDFTRLDGKPGSRLRSMLIGAVIGVAGLAAVAWAGIFFFSRTTGFTGDGVELSVRSDGAFAAGTEEEIIISYRNRERIPLARASLELKVPEGFEVTGSEPASTDRENWTIGSIPSGSSGEVKVRGFVRRELEAAMTFEATLNYKPSDFNSDFEKVSSHTAIVTDGALALTGNGPEEMTPGDEVTLVYEYENRADRKLENVRLTIEPLEGFIVTSSVPKADEDVSLQWTFSEIGASAKGTVTVKGTFSAASRGMKELQAKIGFVKDGNLIVIAKAGIKTSVLKSNLDLSLLVNGTNKPPVASFGDTLYFYIRYENASDVTLKDVTLSSALPSEPEGRSILDWVSLKDDFGGKRTGATIVWTKKEIPALAALSPGDKGEIPFSVQLIRKPFSDEKTFSYAVHAVAAATIAKTGNISGTRRVDTVPLDIRLQSDTSFQAYGRYFTEDGTPVGSGPLPPKAGEKTVYRIYWTVLNTLHELTDLTVSTLLPQGVTWTGVDREVGAGALSFDETGRKATWRLNRMPISVDSVTATFDVEVTPEAEDAGKILDLTGDNRLEAFDKEVGAVILKTSGPIGTDLIGDQNASGKGVVRE